MDAHQLNQEMIKLWSEQFAAALQTGKYDQGSVPMIPVWASFKGGGKFKVVRATVDTDYGIVLELE